MTSVISHNLYFENDFQGLSAYFYGTALTIAGSFHKPETLVEYF